MIIDAICALLIIMAVIKGFRKGLIVGIFSYLTFIIGLAAAMKLSAVVALRIGDSLKISQKWLPFLAFLAVFIVVALLINIAARFVQKLTETLMLGWLNRLGGVVLFTVLYLSVFSVLLFYLEQLNVFSSASSNNSVTAPYIRLLAPKVMEVIGKILPVFKDMFGGLEHFFENIAQRAK